MLMPKRNVGWIDQTTKRFIAHLRSENEAIVVEREARQQLPLKASRPYLCQGLASPPMLRRFRFEKRGSAE
jgi:hypothetical protein